MIFKRNLAAAVAFIGFNTLLTAQVTLNLSSPGQDNSTGTTNNRALEEVNLLPGYSYTASGDRDMNAYLDPTIIAPSSYGNLFSQEDFDNYTIDTDLPVGYTPGAHGVSPSGAATHTVPIQLPPGTNGMEPVLAIAYNSQAGNGLLGMGWNLAGLSVISRTGRNHYHDNEAQPIQFEQSDRFVIDGQRLVATSGTYGMSGTEYETEVVSYSKITSNGNLNGGSGWFKVELKNGTTLEYGRTSNSRHTIYGKTLHWYINKMYDKFGNFIEYNYVTTESETRIETIRYTGHFSGNEITLKPYNVVQFIYQERADKNGSYAAGIQTKRNSLLKGIQISTYGKQNRSYGFQYGFDSASYLTSIEEFGKSQENKLNKTVFKYGDKSALTTLTDIATPDFDGCNGFTDSNTFSTGDFNGNGRGDIMRINRCYGSHDGVWMELGSNWDILTLEEDGDTEYQVYASGEWSIGTTITTINGNYFKSNYVDRYLDFNGDGHQDLLIYSFETSYPYKCTGIGILTLKQENGEVVQEIIPLTTSHFYITSGWGEQGISNSIQVGDFNGDGKQDVLLFRQWSLDDGAPKEARIYSWNSETNTVVGKDVQIQGTKSQNLPLAKAVHAIEFNGDGRTDLMVIYHSEAYIFSYLESESVYEVQELYQSVDMSGNMNHFPDMYTQLYFGDFNGDGLTDILCAGDNGAGLFPSWSIAYSTGTDFYLKTLDVGMLLLQTGIMSGLLGVAFTPLVGDFNGDGLSDIVVGFGGNFPLNYSSGGHVDLYLSNGTGFDYQLLVNPSYASGMPKFWVVGDFNGDGYDDVLHHSIQSTNTFSDVVCYFNQLGEEKLLQEIINGYGIRTEISYSRQSLLQNYEQSVSSSFPLLTLNTPLQLVNEIKVSSANQLNSHQSYWYDSMRLHRQGKGMLGFKSTTIRDEITNIKQVTENYLDVEHSSTSFFEVAMTETKTYDFTNPENELLLYEQTGIYELNAISASSEQLFTRNLTTQEESNHLEGIHSDRTMLYDEYGNIFFDSTSVGADLSDFESSAYSYSNFVPVKEGLPPSLPSNIHATYTRDGSDDLVEDISIEYFPNGNVQKEISRTESTHATSIKELAYNTYGLIESIIISGVKPTEIEVNDDEITFTGTASITPITTDHYAYSADGRDMLQHTDRFGFTTEYTYYDRWAKPKTVTDHLGRQNYFEYDGLGRIEKEVDYLGQEIKTERNWENTDPTFSGCDSESDVLYSKTTYLPFGETAVSKYNSLGQVRFKRQSSQFGDIFSSICYDEQGREIEKTTPHFAGDNNIKTATVSYDGYGRVFERNLPPVETSTLYQTESDGHLTSFTSNASGNRSSKTDLTGRVFETTDPGGTLKRIYQSGGLLKEIKLNNETVAENTYDEFGRQVKLYDVNAGSTYYYYDSFDNLIFQQDANGNILETEYDELGRVEARKVKEAGAPNLDPPPSYDYEYYEDGPEETLLKKETAPFHNHATEYTYDNDLNIESITEIIDDQPHTTSFAYDEFGNPTRKEYPSGFAIRYEYDSKQYLKRITSDDGQLIIWEITNGNAQGQVTNYNLGNGLVMENDYDDDYFPKSTTAENGGNTVFSFEYEFDPVTGNLLSRNLHGTEEHFFYDTDGKQLNRLAGTGPDENTVSETYAFADNGNITNKAGMGPYIYDSDRKNAVSQVGIPPIGGNQDYLQTIQYNHFNSASEIKNLDDDLELLLEYGPDEQRRKAVYENDGDPLKTRIYAGSYEKQTDDVTGETIEVHYISAGGQLIAMFVLEDDEAVEEGEYFYPHQDHLGSIIHITDETGAIFYTQSFDPWGRTRNPNDLTYDNIPERPDWLWRGYTGHEHLDEFGLINMNGRLYDPVVGRMLSPDNYVQSPDFSQSYNRYSYVWNNPLKYNDPNGEIVWVPIIIGAAIGAYSGWQIGAAQGATGWSMVGYIAGGAAIGGLSGYAGGAVAGAIGQNLAFAGAGTVAGASGGAVAGAISGGGFAALGGGNIGEGVLKGAISGFVGGGVGAYVGGGIGAFTGGATSGGLSTALNGGDAKDIAKGALIGGAVAWGGYQLQQGSSYLKYKSEGGGDFTFKQFRKISVASQRSFARGKEFGGWILDNGDMEMWKPGKKASITPTSKPSNAVGVFHTHPNTGGSWVEAHSGPDKAYNNNYARTDSYVIGRQNVWLHTPDTPPGIFLNNSSLYFNTYPYNFYWLSINKTD